MSKISLKPNASGTGVFSLEAPNSNVDRTLNLPDEAGTVLTSSGFETVNSTMIAPNAVTTSKLADSANHMSLVEKGSTSTVSEIDIDISAETATMFKLYLRDWDLGDTAFPVIQIGKDGVKQTSNYFGGASRAGENAVAQVFYASVDSFYLLGDTSTTTDTNNLYYPNFELTIFKSTRISLSGFGMSRVSAGATQTIQTGGVQIDTSASQLSNIYINSNVNFSIKYSLYRINAA